jgi:hypothetical protein
LQLLQCIADQVTSVLLNLRLANEVARSRELEAFRTMSAFFVHDLKNAAASLNLMLQNLPVHFDDPAFREDALHGIGNTARRIDKMIAGLTALRQRPAFKPVEADLNQLVSEVLHRLDGMPHVELTKEIRLQSHHGWRCPRSYFLSSEGDGECSATAMVRSPRWLGDQAGLLAARNLVRLPLRKVGLADTVVGGFDAVEEAALVAVLQVADVLWL